jgi:putative salt-induced outer membrane protein
MKKTLIIFLLFSHSALAELPSNIKKALESAFESRNSFVKNSIILQAKDKYDSEDVESYLEQYRMALVENEIQQKAEELARKPYKGVLEFGAEFNSGNTNKNSLNARTEFVYEKNKWKNILKLKALNSEENDNRTEEEYRANDRLDYNFSQLDYFFGEVEYIKDRFSSFRYRLLETGGYGRYFVKNKKMQLSVTFGLGGLQTEDDSGDKEEKILSKIGGEFDWQVNDAIKFEQDIDSSFSQDVSFVESNSAIRVKIKKQLYLKFNFNFEHISKVESPAKHTDTKTTLVFGYSF